jgi:hypothetical protein
MVGGRIQQLDWRTNGIGKLHHAEEKLRPPTTTLWTIIHFHLERGDRCLLWLLSPMPLRFKGIHNTGTRFVRTAKDHVELRAIFISNPARYILLLATQIMI